MNLPDFPVGKYHVPRTVFKVSGITLAFDFRLGRADGGLVGRPEDMLPGHFQYQFLATFFLLVIAGDYRQFAGGAGIQPVQYFSQRNCFH